MRLKYKYFVVAVALSLNCLVAKPSGIDTGSCTGSAQKNAIEELRSKLSVANPIYVPSCKDSSRCDGGFSWLPYMINSDRAWVMYTLPKKGNRVSVSIRNICSGKRVLWGDFLNEENSPYLIHESAFALGWPLDSNQLLFKGYENIVMRLYRLDEGDYQVGLFGVKGQEEGVSSTALDDFSLSPL